MVMTFWIWNGWIRNGALGICQTTHESLFGWFIPCWGPVCSRTTTLNPPPKPPAAIFFTNSSVMISLKKKEFPKEWFTPHFTLHLSGVEQDFTNWRLLDLQHLFNHAFIGYVVVTVVGSQLNIWYTWVLNNGEVKLFLPARVMRVSQAGWRLNR